MIYGPYFKPPTGEYQIIPDLTRQDMKMGPTEPLVFEVAMNGSDILLQENIS